MELMMAFEGVRQIVGLTLVLAGLALALGAAIGLLRFPDFYTRLHAVSVADPLGSTLIALGLLTSAPDGESALRIGLLTLLVVALGPLWSHLLAAAAHSGGLAPIAGPYRAPRPGDKEEPSP